MSRHNCHQGGGRATVGLSPCRRYFSASHFSALVWELPGSLARIIFLPNIFLSNFELRFSRNLGQNTA